MNGDIRQFEDRDYPGIVAVANAVNPEYPTSVKSMSHWDAHREERIVWNRYIYAEDEEILGVGMYSLMSWMFHPRKFSASVSVHPEHRRRGIGSALFDRILEDLKRRKALSVRGEIREDRDESRRFAEKRGFAAGMREQESVLDLTRFDPAAFAPAFERMEAEGIKIVSYEDLADDPDRHRKLYESEGASEKDMPAPEPLTQPDFETYCKQTFEHPNFRPDTFMVALDDDAYVGISNLWNRNAPGTLGTAYTGVLREYRGRGIATALKVAVLGFAKEIGIEKVYTWNDSTNDGMLGINRRLGFEKRPAWIDHELKLGPEEEDAAESEKEIEESA